MDEHKLHIKVVTPDGIIFEYNAATLVVLNTTSGELGIMANHMPVISALKIGEIKLIDELNELEERMAVSGGFAEFSNNTLTVVADAAERADDIDVARAESAKERAERRIAQANSARDADRARLALLRAVNRIHVVTGK